LIIVRFHTFPGCRWDVFVKWSLANLCVTVRIDRSRQWQHTTHPCRSPAPNSNSERLWFTSSDAEHKLLRKNTVIWCSVTSCGQHRTPATLPKDFHPIVWVSSSFASITLKHLFSKRLAYTYPGRLKEMPGKSVHSLLSPFLRKGMMTPVYQTFGALPEHQATWYTRVSRRTPLFKALSISGWTSSQPSQPSVLWQLGWLRLRWWYFPPQMHLLCVRWCYSLVYWLGLKDSWNTLSICQGCRPYCWVRHQDPGLITFNCLHGITNFFHELVVRCTCFWTVYQYQTQGTF